MEQEKQYNFGDQPLIQLMEKHGLKSHDLVAQSNDQMTHKMVSRAMKGRRLTARTKNKILSALNAVTQKQYSFKDLFNY